MDFNSLNLESFEFNFQNEIINNNSEIKLEYLESKEITNNSISNNSSNNINVNPSPMIHNDIANNSQNI